MSLVAIQSAQSRQRACAPLLTIGIPTWNRVDRLCTQLEEIQPLLGADVELLVCDNGSTDSTWALLQQQVAANGCAIRCVRNGVNLGADENYLRVIEASAGDWLWLVGDDDSLNFQLLPELMCYLRDTESSVALLVDTGEHAGADADKARVVGVAEFLQPRHDNLEMLLFQVGRVLCRTADARRLLPSAHRRGVGWLHAYALVYGPLLADKGLLVLTVALLTPQERQRSLTPPRWNLIHGHMGAWESALLAFPNQREAVMQRERRMRQRQLLVHLMEHLVNGRPVARDARQWMFRSFDFAGKVLLIGSIVSFKLARRLSLWLLRTTHPGLARQFAAQSGAVHCDY